MKKLRLFVVAIASITMQTLAQDQHLIDSLETKLKKLQAEKMELRHSVASINDTLIVAALDDLSYAYWENSPNMAMNYAKQMLALSEQIDYKKGIGKAYNSMGQTNLEMGNYLAALEFHKKALKIRQEIGDKKGIAGSLNNIGVVYMQQGNNSDALKNFFAALKMNEETGNTNWKSINLNNIAMIYMDQRNYPEALKNNLASLKIRVKQGDKKGISASYINIGNIYNKQNNYTEALKYYFDALKIKEEIAEKLGISNCYNNIASVYTNQGNYHEAFKNFSASLKISEERGDKEGISTSTMNIGITYLKQKKYNEASLYLNKALILSKEVGFPERLLTNYNNLVKLDSAQGKFKEGWEHYKQYIIIRDSLMSIGNTNKTVRLQMQYDFNKQQVADSVKASDEKKLISAELKQEQTKSYALYGGVALLLVFGGFMFNRFKVTQKQKNTIQQQKYLVDEKQKEITDSITYAKRIQFSLLAHQQLLDDNLNEHFILYLPKDIVSGDFYWAVKKDDSFYLAVCDCTGHGVPGAFMSLLNINFLNEAVIEKNIVEPNEIFNYVRKRLVENAEGGNDGMDATLVRFQQNKITYASANNKPVLVEGNNLSDLSADKMPVGKGYKDESFLLYELKAEKGSTVYLFTDGFADQFGGEKGEKKLTRKKFKDLILSIQNKSMQEQGEALNTFITNYRKDVDQIDDILVMCMRI